MSDIANSGIFVSEGLSSGQPIPVRRDTVVAFLGSAPRGPVGIPVTIGGVGEYLSRFGVSGCDGPLLGMISQFFANGGENAIVVRASSSARRHCISLIGPASTLVLEAINPGPYEILRASVDYDGIPSTDHGRFNLVIHRLASRDRPIVEQQEVYRGLSVDIADPNFAGHALNASELVAVKGGVPKQRPNVTFCHGIEVGTSYIYVDPEWAETGCLTDYDLIGCNTEGTGLFAFDQVPSIDIVIPVPDTDDLGPIMLFAAERYCRKRNAILLVDPPAHWRSVPNAIRSIRKGGFASPNVVTYFPRPAISSDQPGSVLGAFAGALASDDARGGVWELSGNRQFVVRDHARLPFDVTAEEQRRLRRVGINALRRVAPSRFEMTGLVTLNRGFGTAIEPDELRLQRTVFFIIDSVIRGTRWAAFQENDAGTWGELRVQVENFLNELFAAGALTGPNVADAGYVICDQETNGAQDRIGDNQVGGRGISFVIGFAPAGHGMQSFRFHQRPVECQVQVLRTEHPVALAS